LKPILDLDTPRSLIKLKPLDAPTQFSLNVNMAKFVDESRAVSPSGIEIRTLDLLEEVGESGPTSKNGAK